MCRFNVISVPIRHCRNCEKARLVSRLVVMSSALGGLGHRCALGSIPTDTRVKTLAVNGALYVVGAGSALVNDPHSRLPLHRGLGIGVSTIAAPAYVTMAPAEKTRTLGGDVTTNIVRYLIAYLSKSIFRSDLREHLALMLGVQVVPALIYTVMVLSIPLSPRCW